jgi:peptide/nickel transport system permease protein
MRWLGTRNRLRGQALGFDSIASLDRPVMVTYLMMVSVLFVVINLSVDLAYAVIDPRLRHKGR